MGWLSKAWKGVKKVVKGAAKTIKKAAKKVVTSLPGGKKLWKEAGRIGSQIVKGVGKITNALGPVGMIALSVLAPYAAPLWSSFGAAVGAGGSLSGTLLGSIGNAVYTAGNWVSGTISSMTSGISKAFGTIADGGLKGLSTSLGEAGSQAVKGFADAFTGRAGALGVESGVQAATDFAIKEAAGQTLFDQTRDKIMGDIVGTESSNIVDNAANEAIEKNMEAFDPTNPFQTPQASMAPNVIDQQIAAGKTTASAADVATAKLNVAGATQASGGTMGTALTVGTGSLVSKATSVAKELLSDNNLSSRYQPHAFGDVGGQQFSGDAFSKGGTGSSGGSFLSQAMLQAMQAQQQRMSRGFN